MIRKNFFLTEEQVLNLRAMNEISLSEHIRRAIDQYIERLSIKSATSRSK